MRKVVVTTEKTVVSEVSASAESEFPLIDENLLKSRIYTIRDRRVMLDCDLAMLSSVLKSETANQGEHCHYASLRCNTAIPDGKIEGFGQKTFFFSKEDFSLEEVLKKSNENS